MGAPTLLIAVTGMALPLATASAQLFPAEFELSSLLGANGGDGSTGFSLNGISDRDDSGWVVSDAGDVNGDGIDDIIIGAPHADPNGMASGQSYVVFGRNTPFPPDFELSTLLKANGGKGSFGFVLNGGGEVAVSGSSVSGAGDINADGFDDLIVGSPGSDANGESSGSSYVVFGRGVQLFAELDLTSLAAANGGDGAIGFVINGVAAGNRSGSTVACAGDFNGDGIDDIVVSSVLASPSSQFSGQCYVIYGRGAPFPPDFELSSLLLSNGGNGSEGLAINGVSEDDRVGVSVSTAGDVNADGIDDLIVGSSNADPNGSRSGQSYVVFGREKPSSSEFELSSLLTVNGGDGSLGFAINGVNASDSSGRSVSDAGDVNGDGIDDIIVDASVASPNGAYSGQNYVLFGRATSFPSEFEISSLLTANGGDGSIGFALNGVDGYDYSGFHISGAGDVNGDGFNDLIVGAPGVNLQGFRDGQSYVIFGRDDPFPAEFELSSLLAANGGNGSRGFALNGVDHRDASGRSVSNAGDVNGDGIDDLLVGAYDADPNDISVGQSYVIFGRSLRCNPADLAEPFGALDITDAFEFLDAFIAMSSLADLAPPVNTLNFSDVLAFLTAFTNGCP